jgi:hypothetical protein
MVGEGGTRAILAANCVAAAITALRKIVVMIYACYFLRRNLCDCFAISLYSRCS